MAYANSSRMSKTKEELDDYYARHRREGGRPTILPPEDIRWRYRKMHQAMKFIQQELTHQPTSITNTIHVSRRPLRDLRYITIPYLLMHTPTYGTYIILRTIEEGYSNGIYFNTVVEDHSGNVCEFNLCNYPERQLFTVGTTFILKEPCFIREINGKEFLKCNCPTDVILERQGTLDTSLVWRNSISLPENLRLPRFFQKTTKCWHQRGDEFVLKNHYPLAMDAYTKALHISGSKDCWMRIQVKIASVHLVLGQFSEAIKTAESVTDCFENNYDGLMIAGRAYYLLRQYASAYLKFESLRKFHPNDTGGLACIERAQERLQEQQTHVLIQKLESSAIMEPYKLIDCADYLSPLILYEDAMKRTTLTADIVKGTVLVVANALSTSLIPGEPFDVELDFLRLVSNTVQLVSNNPTTFGQAVFNMYADPGSETNVKRFCDQLCNDEPICDVERIHAICSHNRIGWFHSVTGNRLASCLYALPTFTRTHDYPNLSLSTFNNIVVVRAIVKIKAQSELSVSHFN